MMKPVALFDLDGTLAAYDEALARDLAAIAGPNDPPLPTGYFENAPAYLEARRQMITSRPGWFRNLNPLSFGVELFHFMRLMGFQNHILTKGPRKNRQAFAEKAEWCDRYFPGHDVHVVSNKGLTYGRVLVDDWPPYVMDWLAHRPRGLVIMPRHDYNETFEHPQVIVTNIITQEVRGRLQHALIRQDGEP